MARRASSVGRLQKVTVADLRRELSRRKRRSETLLRKRERVAAKLRALDEQLAALGEWTGRDGELGVRKRFRNEKNLADALAGVLEGKTLSVGEAMEAVQRAGYRTTARNFRVMVNLTLTKDKRFKRVRRGAYTAK